jgi:protoheme IX farnesyltransferase
MTESINLLPIILFIIIFLWTPPHFWSLALVKTEDYKKANIPMMPNVVGETSTKKQILFYSFLLLISSLSPFILGLTGYIYFFGSFTMSLGFCFLSIGLIIFPNRKLEIPLFIYSIFYLFGIFVFLVIDKYFVV